MKKLALIILFIMVIVPLTAGPISAGYGGIKIISVQYDGDCAKIKFDRKGKGVTIMCKIYTLGSSGWHMAHNLSTRKNSGNYVQFCGLNTYRGKSKYIVKIIYKGVQQDLASGMRQ